MGDVVEHEISHGLRPSSKWEDGPRRRNDKQATALPEHDQARHDQDHRKAERDHHLPVHRPKHD